MWNSSFVTPCMNSWHTGTQVHRYIGVYRYFHAQPKRNARVAPWLDTPWTSQNRFSFLSLLSLSLFLSSSLLFLLVGISSFLSVRLDYGSTEARRWQGTADSQKDWRFVRFAGATFSLRNRTADFLLPLWPSFWKIDLPANPTVVLVFSPSTRCSQAGRDRLIDFGIFLLKHRWIINELHNNP